MRAGFKSQLGRDLNFLFQQGAPPSGDRALLERFLATGDESAFEALVARHGPMVRGVCRRLLSSPHDADDAFQATFLVLVRKAGRLHDADRLGPWLYGVASRVATKARAREARHRHQQTVPPEGLHSRDGGNTDLIDVRPILDAELARVSAKLRDVLVLCLLEGATAEEASLQLGCPVGTVKSRLARGRDALRTRLIGRGVAPAVALAAASSIFTSPVSAALTRATLGAIAGSPASLAPGLVALTRGVAPAMISKTTAMTTMLLGGIALTGLGTATWSNLPVQAQQAGAAEARPAGRLTPDHDNPREVSSQHIRQILLAFHNYNDSNGHLPPASIHGPDGQPKLSWRVALLPYLDEGTLYNQFHLNEPWDSPHNKTLIARMPAVFETPDSPAPETQTRFRGFMGPGAMFEGTRGIGFNEVTDGTSNTVLIASAREPIVWTRPGELIVQPGQPLPAIDEADPFWCLVGMADGAALYVPPGDQHLLVQMITRSGGEVISFPTQPGKAGALPPATPAPIVTYPALPAAGGPGMMGGMMASMGTTVPTATPTIEQRLQSLEEKLDLLIQKLDAQTPAGAKP
ncbi:sigma-70 family RNA polymerase sigma factor [Tundrisphaera lichenicola]|uniref:sigma-70 family RNA polymerase sigma factor n=1 Tax=Tundrisphaera lichenicola TaxID=2029860 RepID=UPI003EBE1BEF